MTATPNRPKGVSFICYILLANALCYTVFGAALFLADFGTATRVIGLAVLVGGLAIGRAVGFFLDMNRRGFFLYVIGSVLLSLSFAAGMAAGKPVDSGAFWLTLVLTFLFALAVFSLFGAFLHDQWPDS